MDSFSTANATATGWSKGNATTFGNTTTFNGGANAFGSGMTMPIVHRSSRYYVIKYVKSLEPFDSNWWSEGPPERRCFPPFFF
jgi:hypothetical protein